MEDKENQQTDIGGFVSHRKWRQATYLNMDDYKKKNVGHLTSDTRNMVFYINNPSCFMRYSMNQN